MGSQDPRGYYRVLGVKPDADAAEIKAAFRRKAMGLHPDRNDEPGATERFQLLNEAYGVLSNPEARAQYDTMSLNARPKTSEQQAAAEEPPEPVVCSCCGKVTAQPRYVIFFAVKSFILVTSRSATQGIFCSACAEKKALKASAITWVLGWWGIPWGPIYSIQAIFTNLFGGKRPANINARLTTYQAWVFACLGKIDIARAIALDAMEFAKKVKPGAGTARVRKRLGHDVADERAELQKQIQKLLSLLGDGTPRRLKNSWRLLRRPFYIQGAVVSAIAGLLGIAVMTAPLSSGSAYSPPRGPKPYVATPLSPIAPPVTAYAPARISEKPKYVRPTTAPNGEVWPVVAGYVKGYPRLNWKGLSQVTVDNMQNDSAVFVKLVSLSEVNARPVRSFYIPAHGSFTLSNVTAGTYDVRYRDLNTGGLSRSEQFLLEETPTYQGTQYSSMTLTLYKVRNGNMRTYGLAEDEF
ncbi:J domain-containing protein [Castellaniella sp.]|uniref:J domain-containing protein n=1 Tax=Castellaniella sp. TaxID=1955812 RepID=UPI003C772211